MDTQTLIAFILNRMNGTIHGRVQLQKLIYFCKAYGTIVDAKYKLYIYGPYSQQVADALQEGVMDDIFFETRGLISKGNEFERFYESVNQDQIFNGRQEKIVNEVLNTFGDMSTDQLEILATTFFIFRQQTSLFGNADKECVLDKVRRAKSSRFTEEQIADSYQRMENVCIPLAEKCIQYQ